MGASYGILSHDILGPRLRVGLPAALNHMQFAFGFLLFLLGFLMLMGGVGLLIGGEITLKSGKKIPKLAGRKAGIALVSFLPLIAIALFILRKVDPDRTLETAVVTWPLAAICLGLAAFWVRRGMKAAEPKRFVLTPLAKPQPRTGPLPGPAVLEFDMPSEAPTLPPPAPQLPIDTPALGKPARPNKSDPNPFEFQ